MSQARENPKPHININRKPIKKAQVALKEIKREPLKEGRTRILIKIRKILQKITKSIINVTLVSNNKDHRRKKLTLRNKC